MDTATYGLLLKKIKSSITGIGSVEAVPPNKLKFTNKFDNSQFTITLPMNMTQAQLDWLVKMFDKVVINDTTGDVEYNGIPLNNIVFDTKANFDGNTEKIYCEVTENVLYRFNGTSYVQVGGMSIETIEVVNSLPTNPTVDDLDKYVLNKQNNKTYRCVYDTVNLKYDWSYIGSDIPNTIEVVTTLQTPSVDTLGNYVLLQSDNEIYKCVLNADNVTYEWVKIKEDTIKVVDSLPTASVDNLGLIYFLRTDNHLYKCVEDASVAPSTYDFEDVTAKGVEIVDDYSKLPVTTNEQIVYCKEEYEDVANNKTYVKGFYLYDVVDSKWTLITEEQVTYKEEITTSSDVWLIQHNLKCQHPSKVYVFDEDGMEVVMPEITYDSMNLLTITFDFPIMGSVIVIK